MKDNGFEVLLGCKLYCKPFEDGSCGGRRWDRDPDIRRRCRYGSPPPCFTAKDDAEAEAE